MDRFYKHSLSSSSIRSGSSSLPNSFQQPLPLSMAFAEDDSVAIEIGISEKDVPQPLDCLQGTPIPPFLSKTFDLVDDPKLDHIISWRDTGASFVVRDPVEFSRTILPRNFKHNNLSSFIRQLNIYGFRKIDTDRWEFACENFLRGKKHLLKNIHRRKSLQSHQVNEEYCSLSIEAEVERLQKEKIQMMQEVIELKNQQRGTQQYMESLNEKLQAAEDRQKQMVSSLAKVFHGHISSPRNVRKFFKHQKYNQDCELEPIDPIPVYDTVRNLDLLPLQLHQIDLQELAQTEDPIPKEESFLNLDVEATEGYLLSSAVNLVKQEDIWSPGFENIAAMPSSSNKIWNDVGNYEFPEFDVGGGELSDFWNLATASDGENWPSDETSFGKANQYGF